ncbi:BLOC-1-related complex subunit 7-like isoform X2 [Amphiura filiformis]
MDPRLPLKIQENVTDVGALAKQIIRGSKSNELMVQAAKSFAAQEHFIQNSHSNLKKMTALTSHLQFQAEAIERSVEVTNNLQDQLSTLQR